MASKAGDAIASFWSQLRRVITVPWKVTGPSASPENLTAFQALSSYRKVSPGSIPRAAVAVPHSKSENVYNIKYFDRDPRLLPTKRTVYKLDPATVDLTKDFMGKKHEHKGTGKFIHVYDPALKEPRYQS
eukprot:jgi/Mesvir1/11755/Mv00125-RA.1